MAEDSLLFLKRNIRLLKIVGGLLAAEYAKEEALKRLFVK
jgi:hypothetical protein